MDFIRETKSKIESEILKYNSQLNVEFNSNYNLCESETEYASFLLRTFNSIKKQHPKSYKNLKETHKIFKKWYIKNNYDYIDIENTLAKNKQTRRLNIFLYSFISFVFLSAGFYKMFSGKITVGISSKYFQPVVDNGLIYILIGTVFIVFAIYQHRKRIN